MRTPLGLCETTLAICALLLTSPASASSKFTLEVVGAATNGRYVQTSPATTYCNPVGYGVTCQRSPGYGVTIPQVYLSVKAEVDGQRYRGVIWCQVGLRRCATLSPGLYKAELKGNNVFVWAQDGKKVRRVKYHIVSYVAED